MDNGQNNVEGITGRNSLCVIGSNPILSIPTNELMVILEAVDLEKFYAFEERMHTAPEIY